MQIFEGREAPIQPLIPTLEFIKKKDAWGFYFRRGLFEVNAVDFGRIAKAIAVQH